MNPDSVRDKVRRVFGHHDSFSQTFLGHTSHRVKALGIRVSGGDDLQQLQVARGVKEVRPQKVRTDRRGEKIGQGCDRKSRGVGAQDRSGSQNRSQALVKRFLDLQIFRDRLDYPVKPRKIFEVVLQIPRGNQVSIPGAVKCRRFRGKCSLFPLGGQAIAYLGVSKGKLLLFFLRCQNRGNQIQQESWNSSVGQLSSNGATHNTGSQYCHLSNLFFHRVPCFFEVIEQGHNTMK